MKHFAQKIALVDGFGSQEILLMGTLSLGKCKVLILAQRTLSGMKIRP
jgi:hypothetical protein